MCEALRFPGDGSPDVTNDCDDADSKIGDEVPDDLQMATKIDVRDTRQIRGELLQRDDSDWSAPLTLLQEDFVN